MNDINLEKISLDNIDDAVRMLDIELTRVLDLHAPLKTRRVTDRKKEPWYEDHVKQQKNLSKTGKQYGEDTVGSHTNGKRLL